MLGHLSYSELLLVIHFVDRQHLFIVVLAYILARPSSEANNLEVKILETKIELSRIKSVQLELVKHSKLSRSLIKYEKELETIQAQYAPKALQVKKIFRIIRVGVLFLCQLFLVLLDCGLYCWWCVFLGCATVDDQSSGRLFTFLCSDAAYSANPGSVASVVVHFC